MIAKACPFCGSTPELHRHLHSKDVHGKKWFVLGGGKAKGKWQWNTYSISCKLPCKVRPSARADNEEDVFNIWNNRNVGSPSNLRLLQKEEAA